MAGDRGRPARQLPDDAYQGLRLLLTEDNPINQVVTLRLLERLGCGADIAINGREALEAVAHQAYDIILMDVQMPDVDGEQATRRIRAYGDAVHQPYIIALTAHALAGDRERAIMAGMNAYLSKPVQLGDLRTALAEALAQRVGQGAAAFVPPLDWGVFAEMVAGLTEEAPAQLPAIRSLLHDDLGPQIAQLGPALDGEDRAAIARLARGIRQASQQLGATILAGRCEALEQQAIGGSRQDLEQRHGQIRAAYDQVLRLITTRFALTTPG